MEKRFSQGLIIIFAFLLFISFVNIQYIYALTLKEEAESYRMSGYEAQERGNIDSAISWYQKAASLDPEYPAPHNDLGILFEAKGWLDRAESEYQKALAIDPDYEKAHTNLALLYERKGELEKAAFHWMRRYRLGRRGDPWTEQARQRLEKLGLLDKTEKRPEIVTGRRPERERIEERRKEEMQKEWLGEERYRKRQLKMQQREEERQKKPPERKKLKEEKEKKRLEREKQKEEERRKKQLEQKRKREEERQKRLREGKKRKGEREKKPERPRKVKKKRPKSKEWTRLGFKDTKKSEKKKIAKDLKSSKKDLDRELQESLRLAEKRLREQKAKKESPGKESRRQRKTSPGARSYYLKAENYYKKGEYARALDTIRTAKKDYPGDSTLLELEQSIKNKMKEERIEDHYNEGIMRYHQKDFLGAKKEFEAILNILPE